jgi:hypothetical protein
VAFGLESVLQGLVGRRGHIDERYHRPPHPAVVAAAPEAYREQSELDKHRNGHRDYQSLSEAISLVEPVLRLGEDFELSARLVLFPDAVSKIEGLCRDAIRLRRYEWVECRPCGRRYAPEACGESDWGQVADVLAGVGGKRFQCPAGHVFFVVRTWVA